MSLPVPFTAPQPPSAQPVPFTELPAPTADNPCKHCGEEIWQPYSQFVHADTGLRPCSPSEYREYGYLAERSDDECDRACLGAVVLDEVTGSITEYVLDQDASYDAHADETSRHCDE